MLFCFEDFVLDTARRELRRGPEPRPLEPQVFDVLEYLLRNRNRVVSKADLLSAVWNGRIVSDATLASRINAARTAIGDNGKRQRLIRTAFRKGIRFIGEVRETSQSEVPAREHPGEHPSIAVLPFENMSGDPEQEYFADGMVDDIITGLSRIKWLFVIARNTSFIYKGTAVDVKQVGRELGVHYVLEGSMRKAGNRIRITAQLVETKSGHHVWAERYDRMVGDIFVVQDELTASVVGAIEPNLRKVEIERIKRKRPDSLDAYDLVLRALPFVYNMMPNGAAAAIPLLEKALELEPHYPLAHAALAWCHHFRFSRAGFHDEDRAGAIDHARKAIAGGTDDATALAIAALVIWFLEHDDATTFDLLDRALALSKCNIYALCCSAVALAWTGNTNASIERAQEALRFSPFDSLSYMAHGALAISHFQMKRYDMARDAARHAVECNPHFSGLQAILIAALVRLGRSEEAQAAAKRLLALDPTFSVRNLAVIVGAVPAVFAPFAEAWIEAGLPKE